MMIQMVRHETKQLVVDWSLKGFIIVCAIVIWIFASGVSHAEGRGKGVIAGQGIMCEKLAGKDAYFNRETGECYVKDLKGNLHLITMVVDPRIPKEKCDKKEEE
jgi:hypothetical protein